MNLRNGIKRGLSLLLLLAMVLGMLPWAAFPARAEDSIDAVAVSDTPQEALDLIDAIENLEAIVPIARWHNHVSNNTTGSNISFTTSLSGKFFIVNVLSKDGKQYAFAMDPTMPSTYGTFPAIPVTLQNTNGSDLPQDGTTLLGVTEDMAITFAHPTTLSNKSAHTLQLNGPYSGTANKYYIHIKYSPENGNFMTAYPKAETSAPTATGGNGGYVFTLENRPVNGSQRVSFTFSGPKESGSDSYYHYLSLTSADPDSPDLKYGLATNTSKDVGSYISFADYFGQNGRASLEQVTSYFFQLLENRVDTTHLYSVIGSMAEVLQWNDFYDPQTYSRLCTKVQEAIDLYNIYNGVDFTGEALTRGKEAVAAMARELLNLSYVLKINTQNIHASSNFQGNTISHFDANMYVWNEAELNEITYDKDPLINGKRTKGFYFGATPGQDNSSYPLFSKFEGAADYVQVLRTDGVDYTQTIQSYAIYSGLASETLTNGSPLAGNSKIVEPGLWEPSDWSQNGVDLRKVYTDVSVPFVYDKETGYYTLNSDTHGVYFEGVPENSATLQIADKPTVINIGPGTNELIEDPKTHVSGKYTTYGLYDAYSTAFQPFATVTDKQWKGFSAYSPMQMTKKTPLDGYLLGGIPGSSDAFYGEMGKAIYGTGMALAVDFYLTENGRLKGKDITFNFGGDDDVWVYIDDKLVLDIGGIHGSIQGSINFATGTVSVFSERFGRIADLAGGDYTEQTGLYNFYDGGPQTFNNNTYGGKANDSFIVTSMDDPDVTPRIYQKNLYTGAKNATPASAEDVAAFASKDEPHTLKVFYMDRGRSRTNCYISFNLPQPDTLVVEKDINDVYGQMVDGELTLTQEILSEKLKTNLDETSFSFVLKKNGQPVPNIAYHIMEQGVRAGKGHTDSNGVFTIQAKQAAHFTTLDFRHGHSYTVEELTPGDLWGTPSYSYSYSNGSGDDIEGTGNTYAPTKLDDYIAETLTVRCLNTYSNYTTLEPEVQKVVLDYGKAIDVEVVRNGVITGASELIVREATIESYSFAEDSIGYGSVKISLDRKSIRFTPEAMLDRVVCVNCVLRLTFEDGGERLVKVPVCFIPATTVYYETDFAPGLFHLYSEGYESEEEDWNTDGYTWDDRPQDNGNVGDQIYDFVIEKEKVPSNAFFVDFDGKGLTERYAKQDQYGGVDFDLVSGYMMNGNRVDSTKTTVNTTEETFDLYLSTSNDSAWDDRYIQTSDRSGSNKNDTPLLFSPGKNDYVQIRFRMNNCGIVGADHLGFTFSYHHPGDNDVVTDECATYILEEEEADLLAGNYVTVCLPLKDAEKYVAASVIKTFRFTFKNVKYIDSSSKICIDYLYVGPLTDKEDLSTDEKAGLVGQDLDSDASSQALYFDFDNSTEAQTRYTQSQYNYNRNNTSTFRNFDTVAASSVNTGDTQGTWATHIDGKTLIYPTVDSNNGTLRVPITDTKGTASDIRPYGTYVGTTSSHNKFCFANADSVSYHSLNFTPQGETWFYMRFKLTGVKLDTVNVEKDNVGNNKKPYVQFSVIDQNGKGYYYYPNYTVENGKYITVAYNVTGKINQCLQVGPIRSLYFRFTHLYQSGSSVGYVDIDYIYVGPKNAGLATNGEVTAYESQVSATVRSPQARNIYMDFVNSKNDQYRYTYELYRNTNPDLVGTWPNRSEVTPQIENGALKMVPTTAHFTKADGWQDLCNTGKMPNLSYNLTGSNDVVKMRFKFIDAYEILGDVAEIGIGLGWTESSIVFNSNMERYWRSVELEEINGQWIEHSFPLASYYTKSKRITHLYPCIQGIRYNTGGYLLIDYIYVGPEDEFEATRAAEDNAVFISFNDTDRDRERFSGSLYSGVNYDIKSGWTEDFYTISMVDNCMKLVPKATYVDTNYYGSAYPAHGDLYKPASMLHYRLTGNDHFQFRFKVVGGKPISGKDAHGSIIFGPDLSPYTGPSNGWCTTGYYADAKTWSITDEQLANEEWIVGDYDLADHNWQAGSAPELIRFLIPAFQYIDLGTSGYILIDYIYLGPKVEARPVSDSLFFGFDDMQIDRERYATHGYTDINYDDPQVVNWIGSTDTRPENVSQDQLSIADGTMIMPMYPATADNGKGWYAMYIGDTYAKRNNSLRYSPKEGDYFQIRFKLKDTKTIATAGKANDDEAAVILYFYTGSNQTDLDSQKEAKIYFDPADADESGYVTLCTPITLDSYKSIPEVTGIAFAFQYLNPADGVTCGQANIDYIYVGPGEIAPDPVYGYDSTYLDDATLSNDSSWMVEGQGVKLPNAATTNYTEASFDFVGTGFDIISRTGTEQATIRVEVTAKGETSPTKTLSVNNKGELELFQIPVVSVRGLAHGAYTVKIWVNKALHTDYEFLNRGGTFYFDAVRIYEPMGVGDATPEQVLRAYRSDKEAYPHVKEIRNILLTAEDYGSVVGVGSGALFVDTKNASGKTDDSATDADTNPADGSVTVKPAEDIELPEHYTLSVETYNKVGPKNEVYLAPGQAVAFNLQISTKYVPVSVDVGVKNIREMEPATFVAGVVSRGTDAQELMSITSHQYIPVDSATVQYYSLNIDEFTFYEDEDNKRYCYIVLYNHGDADAALTTNILSLTDLKLTYDQAPENGLPMDGISDPEIHPMKSSYVANGKRNTEPHFDFVVDEDTVEAAAMVMRATLETPILAEGTEIMHSLNLESDIAINYVVDKTELADYDSFYMECSLPGYEEPVRLSATENGPYYYFTLDGITAVQMGDVIRATLRMEKDGRNYYTAEDSYSVAQYAYAQLSRDAAAPELKTLCAELLRYGAMAQSFKDYRTEALADRYMTEEQKAILTDLQTVSYGSTNRALADHTAPTAKWYGKSLILDSRVTLRYVVDLTAYTGALRNISLRVRYTDLKGEEQMAVLRNMENYSGIDGCYCFDFDGLLAAELRTVLSAVIYAGDEPISETLEYSIDTYGNNKTGALDTLCRALLAYSDAAKAFFAK